MSDNREEQIKRLKSTALSTIDESVRLNSIDALEQYGEDGIDSIQSIINSTISTNVRNHGLQAITRIKSKNDRVNGWKLEGDISSDEG